ncbi:Asp23/Gls24 family envelope stress response protein [Kribbella sp. CA-293567]|uniref:Asp23/Gls24 family envelope stress response protein n=1 Tax=Kribbella sp. CA-293567 TaxID=3002436 RepID=UPI0022DDDDE2|nr:Asp23/Gls24 family envelope stress response protein [Kribbella sp. CA-293567]WBQ04668.1 Asp23/Gls24 family envelope stress response protein [Kribbella sp. CA-293567]
MADTSSNAKIGTEIAAETLPSALVSDYGRTSIADTVVSKIAGIAAREVAGVHNLGGGTARAVGLLRERIPGSRTNLSQGVSVEVGEKQAAIDIEVVADYGVAIADLAQGIRRNVISAVERMTGLEVTEVNIAVSDVHLDGEDDTEDTTDDLQERRVQ